MKLFLSVLFLLCCIFGANAQVRHSKKTALPANMVKWNGEDSDTILKNPALKVRLKNLLGKKNYADFLESWETVNPIVKKGNFLFSSGCLIHACGHIESAIAIDLVTQTIHVGIFREGENTRYFNEQSRKTPKLIRNWANRLIKN